jgi:hypothetical protein
LGITYFHGIRGYSGFNDGDGEGRRQNDGLARAHEIVFVDDATKLHPNRSAGQQASAR